MVINKLYLINVGREGASQCNDKNGDVREAIVELARLAVESVITFFFSRFVFKFTQTHVYKIIQRRQLLAMKTQNQRENRNVF